VRGVNYLSKRCWSEKPARKSRFWELTKRKEDTEQLKAIGEIENMLRNGDWKIMQILGASGADYPDRVLTSKDVRTINNGDWHLAQEFNNVPSAWPEARSKLPKPLEKNLNARKTKTAATISVRSAPGSAETPLSTPDEPTDDEKSGNENRHYGQPQ
jgi:hypothetical protein